MNATIFKQVLYDMKHQPVMGIVSVLGTAMSIFLVMSVVMMNLIKVIPFAPESNRDRTLYGKYIHIASTNGYNNSSSGMSPEVAKKLYGDLAAAECTTIYTSTSPSDVRTPGGPTELYSVRYVDDEFFKVFDYHFVDGRAWDHAAFESGLRQAVVTREVARRTLGDVDPVGATIYILEQPYTVVGVVDDVSPLATEAFAEILVPYTVDIDRNTWMGEFGDFVAAVLASSPAKFDAIRAEVAARKQAFDAELLEQERTLVDHGTPFTHAELISVPGSNCEPTDKVERKQRLVIYAILLLLPAINLSSITRSRMRRRAAETGIRRAFGCTRRRIMADIVAENFVITLAGGIIGLMLCMVFAFFFAGMFFDVSSSAASIPSGALLNWRIFAVALVMCLILNLLSSGIPAWNAARVDPVKAINSKNL